MSQPTKADVTGSNTVKSDTERKTLVLTGASRGIGHATVKRFRAPDGASSPVRDRTFPIIVHGPPGRKTTSRSIWPIRKMSARQSPKSAAGSKPTAASFMRSSTMRAFRQKPKAVAA